MEQGVNKQGGGTQLALMGSCYALGAFADNFYKQAAVLMAAAAAMTAVQSWATVLFSLPFVLFSAWSGWLADRLPKKKVVVAAKALELLAMIAGAFMLLTVNWAGILAVMFVMAAQSALFSPALNGSIPEYFPRERVPGVNAVIKAVSTLAILGGMALAGVFLDARPQALEKITLNRDLGPESPGRALAGLFLIFISAFGLLLSLFLQKKPACGAASPFPRGGPLDSLRQALELRKDPHLFLVLMADCWFYGISVIAVISVANLALGLGFSNSAAGGLCAALMIGVAAGSLVAGRQSPDSWRKLLVPSASFMAATLALCGLTPYLPPAARLPWFGFWLFASGFCGGIYLIPLESFIQVRPAAGEKGRVIALSNCLSFTAMTLFGAIFQALGLLPPALTFVFYGLSTLLFALYFVAPGLGRLPDLSLGEAGRSLAGLLARALLSLRYDLRLKGFDDILLEDRQKRGMLLVANHPSLADPLLCWAPLAGLSPVALADSRQMSGPLQAFVGRLTGAVVIPDIGRDGKKSAKAVLEGLEQCAAALRRGEKVLLFPSGRASRDGSERLANNSAVFRLLQSAPGTRLVFMRLSGLWGSSFSYAFGNKPLFMRCLLRGLVTLLGNALFFSPRRTVTLEADEMTAPPTSENRSALNRAMESYFAAVQSAPLRVRRFFWEGQRQNHRPETRL